MNNITRMTTFRLTVIALDLLKLLAIRRGLTMRAVLETLIREAARQEQIAPPVPPSP